MPQYVRITHTEPVTFQAVVILPSDVNAAELTQAELAKLWDTKAFDKRIEPASEPGPMTVADITDQYGTADVFPTKPEPASRPRGGRRNK